MKYVSLEWQTGSFALLMGALLTAVVIVGFSSDVQANNHCKWHAQNKHVSPGMDYSKTGCAQVLSTAEGASDKKTPPRVLKNNGIR